MHYYFDWDINKAKQNKKKHSIDFDQAATIFGDSKTLSVFDISHSKKYEERWATIGLDKSGRLLVVIHTFENIDVNNFKIRIISARKATKNEISQYMEAKK
jgi:uncharacterized protein